MFKKSRSRAIQTEIQVLGSDISNSVWYKPLFNFRPSTSHFFMSEVLVHLATEGTTENPYMMMDPHKMDMVLFVFEGPVHSTTFLYEARR